MRTVAGIPPQRLRRRLTSNAAAVHHASPDSALTERLPDSTTPNRVLFAAPDESCRTLNEGALAPLRLSPESRERPRSAGRGHPIMPIDNPPSIQGRPAQNGPSTALGNHAIVPMIGQVERCLSEAPTVMKSVRPAIESGDGCAESGALGTVARVGARADRRVARSRRHAFTCRAVRT
jgi:hypothetical protein